MNCKHCDSERIASITAKHNDLFDINIDHLGYNKYDDYAPVIPGVCGGDYTEFSFCLDCGTIQEFSALSDEQLKDILELDEDSSDEEEYGDEGVAMGAIDWYIPLIRKHGQVGN